MTGLLHRLGARATGTGWAVRSDARLPFGADRLGDGEPLPAEPVMPASMETPAPTLRTAATAVPPHAATTVDATKRPAPQAPAPLRPVSARAPTRATPRASTGMAEAPASASPQPDHPASLATTPHAPQHPFTQAMPHDGTPPTHRLQDPAPLRPPRTDVAPTPLMPASRPDRANAAQTNPATRTRTRSQQATVVANAWPTATPAPAIAPTEVHIHIGRIDVTALPAAPAPRTAKPTRTEPMSLDSYLKKRTGA